MLCTCELFFSSWDLWFPAEWQSNGKIIKADLLTKVNNIYITDETMLNCVNSLVLPVNDIISM